MEALATCHGITWVGDTLIGDPLDVKMFIETGWELNEPKDDALTLAMVYPSNQNIYKNSILRRFDFTSALMRMSVISKNTLDTCYRSFVKGSPEKIFELSVKSSIPDNYDDVLNKYTKEGYRVISLAQKKLSINS